MKFSKACGVCLAPGDSVNHLDHLAPIAYFMDIPMVIDETFLIDTMKTYYPQVEAIYVEHHARLLEYLAQNYEYIFCSCANYRADLSPLFDVIFRKKMEFWYCNHGHSDKSLGQFKHQNLIFTYGPFQEKRLREEGHLEGIEGSVRTGNYRLSYYHKFQSFYDKIVDKEIFTTFAKKQTTLLYAPTWRDLERSTSFFDVGTKLIEQLPQHYNLIIKLHPWLIHYSPGQVHYLEEKYKDHPNIKILSLYPLMLPLLKRTDIYLGDFSSVSYDFLYCNRPMFFFEGSERISTRTMSNHVHQCGVVIPNKAYDTLFSFIEKHLKEKEEKKALRNQLYTRAFGEERSFTQIKEEVEEVIRNLNQNLGL